MKNRIQALYYNIRNFIYGRKHFLEMCEIKEQLETDYRELKEMYNDTARS